MKRKNGFSLLELILVLGIASAVSFMKFQDLKQEQESVQARAAGEQIKQIGEAVNGYINIRYDKLITLTTATGTGTDPGPRTCSGSVCTITYQTLVNEGLLPASFNGVNANKSGYTILLKRSGTSPNYMINGLITTNDAWIEGSKIRFDLLGKAMQTAGIDSGMAKSAATVSGYSGSWSFNTTDYSNINKTGILGYRVGYDSAMYSVYLRRDGTLPMTGDLDMGNNSINNISDITASGTTTSGTLKSTGDTHVGGDLSVAGASTMTGTLQVNNTINSSSGITAAGNVTAGNWVWAKNGYGDTIGLGGDAAGNDYEIRLGTGKQLTIYSPGAASYSTVLSVNRNSVFEQRIATNGLDPNNLPSGWPGGLRTLDVYASGTVGTGDSSGNIKAYLNASGNIYASGNLQADGNITSASQVTANGRLTTNEFLQLNGQASVGGTCSPNGLQGRSPSGNILSCVDGIWKSSAQGTVYYNTVSATAYRFPSATAYCNGNDIAVGGGGQCSSKSGYIWLNGNRPIGTNAWFASCDQNKTDDGNSNIITYVKCATY
ncbi:type II secretion system protein [Klebsiella michiganensis]|uniref:type II secretion system protein n=1 Tax=Klebsiella michiganensis TaxID=1134687 RepID=UPI00094960C2|nr:type II secretion system protein [Klebsiella michiganensis]